MSNESLVCVCVCVCVFATLSWETKQHMIDETVRFVGLSYLTHKHTHTHTPTRTHTLHIEI